jgi:hypothetical protein
MTVIGYMAGNNLTQLKNIPDKQGCGEAITGPSFKRYERFGVAR